MEKLRYSNKIDKGYTTDSIIFSMIEREAYYYETKIGKDLIEELKKCPDGCYVKYKNEVLDDLHFYEAQYTVEITAAQPCFVTYEGPIIEYKSTIEDIFCNIGNLIILPFKIFGL